MQEAIYLQFRTGRRDSTEDAEQNTKQENIVKRSHPVRSVRLLMYYSLLVLAQFCQP